MVEHTPWPWWAIFPVLATLIIPGVVLAYAVIAHWKRQMKADGTLKWCRLCDEWMYANQCEGGNPKLCERGKSTHQKPGA